MTASDDLAITAGHVSALRDSVASPQAQVGETVDLAWLTDDVAGWRADPTPATRADRLVAVPERTGEKIYIPDGDYDPSFRQDAEDEGLGVLGRKG